LNLTIPYQKPLGPLYHPCFIDGVPHPMDDMVAIHEERIGGCCCFVPH
jgi:hypothetical protein